MKRIFSATGTMRKRCISTSKENNSPTCNFGEHLTLDGYDGDAQKLNDKDLIHQCLEELPELLNMKKLCKPHVYNAQDNQRKDPGGWSGFVLVGESHISIHTFPKRRFLSADVYTCKNGLNTKLIIDYFKRSFGLQDVATHLIKRGTSYPAQDIY